MLQSIDPKWRVCCWLQLVVQDITDKEVRWCELVTLLMLGAEGTTLALAKHLIMMWRWSLHVHGGEACPPAPTVFNVKQFMTENEVAEKVGEPHWFIAYSHALQ